MGKGKKAMLEVSKMKMTQHLAQNISANGMSPDGNVNLMTLNAITTRVVRT